MTQIVTDSPRNTHNFLRISLHYCMAPCVNFVCLWAVGKLFGMCGKRCKVSLVTFCLPKQRSGCSEVLSPGQKGKRIVFFAIALTNQGPCVLQQDVLLSWMAQECVRFIGAAG
jgi:hypothetical protein